ncbi:MAG: O-antigen ligase family protein [Candidatus Sericytochromatia bacterium]|nr:O-antigen ligase family protein [Candidatus Sericytochromatia bacterium]
MSQLRRWETVLLALLLFFVLGWSAFNYGGRYLHAQTIVQVAAAALLLNVTWLLWRYQRARLVPDFPLLLVGLFWLLALALSWIFSVNQLASLEEVLRLAMYMALTLSVYLALRLQKDPERATYFVLSGIVVLGCLMVAMGWWLRSDGQALSGTFYRTNDLAGYLLLLVPLSLHLGLQARHMRARLYYWLAFTYLLAALVMTNSRSSWLAGGIAVCMVMLFNRSAFRQRAVWLVFAAGGLLAGILVLLNLELILPRLQTLLDLSIFKESAARWRMDLLLAAWDIFRDDPLVGTGPNTYAKVLPAYQQTAGYYSINPHNYYLQTLAEVGVLGFLALGLWISQGLRSLWRQPNPFSLGVLGALSASLIHIAFDIDWSVSAIPILFFVLLGLGLVPLETASSAQSEPEPADSLSEPAIKPGQQRVTAVTLAFVAVLLGLIPLLNLASAQAYARGAQALESQDYEAALPLLERARRLAPWPSARHYYSLGRCWQALEESETAYQMALRAIELDAYNGEYYGFASGLLLQKNQTAEALALLLRRQTLNPYRYPVYYTQLGDVYLNQMDQPQQALKTYLQGAAAFPPEQLARYERYLPQHRYEVFNLYQKLAAVYTQLNQLPEAQQWQVQAQQLVRSGVRDLYVQTGYPYPVAALKAYWDAVPQHLKNPAHRFDSLHPEAPMIPPPPWPVRFEQLRFVEVERDLNAARLRYAMPRQEAQSAWILLEDRLVGSAQGWHLVSRQVIEP